MKKVAFIMVGLLAILFSGCGEGSSTAGGNGEINVGSPTVNPLESEITTPKTPHNLSVLLGTPPGLPSN